MKNFKILLLFLFKEYVVITFVAITNDIPTIVPYAKVTIIRKVKVIF